MSSLRGKQELDPYWVWQYGQWHGGRGGGVRVQHLKAESWKVNG